LADRHLKPKIKKFYSVSLNIFFVAMALSVALKHDIWFVFGGILVFTLGWLIVWFLYSKEITKTLPASNSSYSEIVLEKISPDESDDESAPVDEILPTEKVSSTRQISISRFSILRRYFQGFIFSLTPMHWGLLAFVVGMGMFGPISIIFPQKGAHPLLEAIYTAIALFFMGLFSFIMATTVEIPKENISAFVRWKLMPILTVFVFWGLGIYFIFSELFDMLVK
jgi:hypothetical protein